MSLRVVRVQRRARSKLRLQVAQPLGRFAQRCLRRGCLDRLPQRRVGGRQGRVRRLARAKRARSFPQRARTARIGAANVGGALQGTAERLPLHVRQLVRLRGERLHRITGRLSVFVLERVTQGACQRLGSQRFAHRRQRLVAQVGVGVGQLLVELVRRAGQDGSRFALGADAAQLGLCLLEQLIQLARLLGRSGWARRPPPGAAGRGAGSPAGPPPARRPAGRGPPAAGSALSPGSPRAATSLPGHQARAASAASAARVPRRACFKAGDRVGPLQRGDRLVRVAIHPGGCESIAKTEPGIESRGAPDPSGRPHCREQRDHEQRQADLGGPRLELCFRPRGHPADGQHQAADRRVRRSRRGSPSGRQPRGRAGAPTAAAPSPGHSHPRRRVDSESGVLARPAPDRGDCSVRSRVGRP